MHDDIRWKQRYRIFLEALETLTDAVHLSQQRDITKLEQQGVIQGFEFTHELAWNVLKDYLEEQGVVGLIGSKNATRSAFENTLIDDGDVWMDMIRSRNLTFHTYNSQIAEETAEKILIDYYPAFAAMVKTFDALLDSEKCSG